MADSLIADRIRTEVNANDVQFLDSVGRQEGGAPAGDSGGAVPVSVPAGGDVDPDDIPF